MLYSAPEQSWMLERKVNRSTLQVLQSRIGFTGGLVIPYQEEEAVERTQYFCPRKNCIVRFPPWTNTRHPSLIHANNTITDEE